MEWWIRLVCFGAGIFVMALIMSWHSSAKCRDCEKIGRIWNAGKQKDDMAQQFEEWHDKIKMGGK